MARLVRFLLLALILTVALETSAGSAGRDQARIHTVWHGQRLGSIAKRYNVTIEAICHANGIKRNAPIYAGQKLVIPARDDKTGSRAKELKAQGFVEGKVDATGQLREAPTDVQPAARAAAKKPEAEAPVKKPTGPLRLHEVQRGQRLGSIAKRYKVTVSALCYANAIEARAPIKPGQLLIVPPPDDVGGRYARKQLERGALEATLKARGESGKAAAERRTKQAPSASSSWKPYVKPPWRRGYVNVVGYHKSFKGYVIGKNGVIIGRARKEISSILTPMGRRPPIDSRLIKLLARVSDTFGGRPLRVVSGYRGSSYVKGSRHKSGRAVDFSVIGVPNEVLRDFLRTLDKVGVGYYPNSSFVHLDVRDYPAYWVDYSGPGEAPRYRQRRAPSKDRTSKAPALPAAAMDHDEPVEAPAGTEEALAGTGASSTENSQSSSQTGTPSP